jgi:hypothetical protein
MRATQVIAMAALLCSVLVLSGCPQEGYDPQVSLYPLTAAPPTKVATLDNSPEKLRTIDLSVGVSLAVGCYSYCEDVTSYDACRDVEVLTAHGEVVRVDPIYNLGGNTDRFVLSGVTTGTTNITISTPCGTRTYLTTVSE